MTAGHGTRTVLFTDMVGSTALRTSLGDNAADVLRDEHERILRTTVEDHGGTVVKVMGDGLMAVFDGAATGVAAGVALQQAVHRQAERSTLPIQIRVGIAAGDVTWDADDYHGTPVVEAARLEPKAVPGTVLVSELVRLLAGSRTEFDFAPAGPFELKGLPGPVTAYEVAWSPEADVVTTLPGPLSSCDSSFVGREGEREQLEGLWRATDPDGLHLAFITGEAGIGKSRLAAEVARAAHGDGATVLFGRCDDELDVPYQPVVEALRHFLGQCPPAYLRDELGAGAGELVRLVPELADRFPGLAPAPSTDAETARYRLFEAITAWLAAASETKSILFVIDDLQWGSKATHLFVRHLARSSADLRVLLVATWRDTDGAPDRTLDALLGDLATGVRPTRIRLPGLARQEVDRFIDQALERSAEGSVPVAGLAERLGAALYRKTEGNPFFVQELTRDLLDIGLADLAALDEDVHGRLGVPETVRDVVLRRVRRLDDLCRRVLAAASIVGTQFEVSVVERILNLPGDEVIDSLETAMTARLVRESTGSVGVFQFEHGLFRDVLYSELGATRRARLHARTAAELEAVHAGDLDPWAADIAAHLLAVGSRDTTDRAVEFLIRAGEVAARGLSYEQSVATLEQALSVVESADAPDTDRRLRVVLALGDAKFRTLDFDGSNKAFLQAVEEARHLGRPEALARATCGLARAVQPGAPDLGLGHLLDEALDALTEDDSYLRAQLLAVTAAHSLQNSDQGPRLDLVAEAVAMAERLGDPGEVAFVLGVSVIATFSPDLLEQRLTYIDTQLERSACSGHLEAACEAYGWRATSLVEAGRPDTFRDDVEAMQHLADQLGQPWYRAMAQQRRAMVAQLSGDYETAEALADDSLAAAPQQQLAVLAGYAGLTWTVRRDQGRLAEVEPALVAFAQMTPDVPAWQATIAVTALELGRPDDARAQLDTLVQRGLPSIPKDWLWLATTVLASEVAAAVAEPDLVGELLTLLRPYQRRGVPVAIGVGYLGTTSRALGLLASRLGDHSTAIADLTDALEIETRIGAPAYEARTMVALARVHLDRAEPPDSDRAADLLLHARAIAERLGLGAVASDASTLLSVVRP